MLARLSDTTSDRYRIKLFDSSKLHKLDPSASNFRTEHDFFVDAFFKHRWHSGNHKRDVPFLIQVWNASIHNVGEIGCDAWLDNLLLARNRFEKRTSTSGCQERPGYHSSLGVMLAKDV